MCKHQLASMTHTRTFGFSAMKKVFISYSWKDEAITLRLYRDLKRQNISIWLDRIDGDPTGDFKQEFLRLIDGCNYFIVIDSENYRHKSHWCETELEECFSRIDQGQNVSMIVCLAGEDKEWRIPESITDEKKRALFERLNAQKFFLLTHSGTYDNERIYSSAVESICKILGKDSLSWDTFPEEDDLIDELDVSIKKPANVSDDGREALKCMMRSILLRRRQQLDVRQHFQLLLSDCQSQGLNLFIIKWAYAIWLADGVHQGYYDKDCLECMKALSKDFPHEARAFRGLGGIAAKMNQQILATDSFNKALELTASESRTIRYEILCNLSQVYLNRKMYNAAKDSMVKALALIDEEDVNESLVVNYFECLYQLNMKAEAGAFIKKQAQKFKTVPGIQRSCGYYFLDCGQPSIAVAYLKRAYTLHPSMENAYGYLCSLLRYGDTSEYYRILSSVDNLLTESIEEQFWAKEIKKLPH